jgi:CRISPR-associated exonuclease Cas4
MNRYGYFTVRDIVDFVFCPRSIYFQHCLRAGKESTPKMVKGRKIHRTFKDKTRRAKMVKELPKLPRIYNVKLHSRRYKFNTVVDCVLLDRDRAFPVEFKASPKPKVIYNTHRFQVAAQALAVEELLGKKVPYAYLRYADGTVVKVEINDKLMERVVNLLKEMEEIVMREKMPKPTPYRKRCRDCHYRNLCRRV